MKPQRSANVLEGAMVGALCLWDVIAAPFQGLD